LIELNNETIEFLLRSFRKKITMLFSESYTLPGYALNDFRNSYNPKIPLAQSFQYHQVFESKHGFIPNLSSIDLLFNNGITEVIKQRN
jgi:hypothetical protein